MGYKICPYCGTHLDPGETCDCRETEEISQATVCEDDKEENDHERNCNQN